MNVETNTCAFIRNFNILEEFNSLPANVENMVSFE